jgi:aminoglycoside phosphotransferase (APT) family kinase protein
MAYEYHILTAMQAIPIPSPRAYGLDEQGEALGVACFFSDFIEGEALLGPMLAGEAWAEALYLDTVCALQAVTEADLGEMAAEVERISAEGILENVYARLKPRALPLAEAVYRRLKQSMPAFPPLRFSNGDLWLENFIVRDGRLAGVIDFQGAGFSDPLYEFLLAFFVEPKLTGRGIEARYCRRIGVDPAALTWYHGLEFFETWEYAVRTGKSFMHHTAENLEVNLRKWLDNVPGEA